MGGGKLNGVDYLMLSMLPILLTKLTASIAIDLFEWKHLMVSKRNIENLIQERQDARKAKNFARADEIRNELLEKGIILEDTREGVKWKRA